MKKTLVIIPAFNEERFLLKVINKLRGAGFQDILVVDDGSKDKTNQVAKEAGVFVVHHIINLGMGTATQTGIIWGINHKYDYFLTIDADGQQSPTDLKKLHQALETHDCVIGSRFLQKNKIPPFRRFANKFANILTGILFGIWVTDSQSGLRGFNRKVAKKMNLYGGGFEYCSDFIREVSSNGFSIHEVPISVKYFKESMQKGQNLSQGITTFGKLFLKAILR